MDTTPTTSLYQDMEKTPVFVFDRDQQVCMITFYAKAKLAKPNVFIQVTDNMCERLPTQIPGAPAYLLVRSLGHAKEFFPIQGEEEIALMKKNALTSILVVRALHPKTKKMKRAGKPTAPPKSNLGK